MAPDRRRSAPCRPCRWEAQDVGRPDRVAMLLPWRSWPVGPVFILRQDRQR